jgi:hypothetical protein
MSRFASTAQLLAGGIAAAFTVASAAAQTASPPDFSSNLTSWAAGIGVDFTPVEGSPSPLRQDPAHPFVPNGTGRQPTYRIADLSNPNLKQWAKDIMKKDNDEVIAGKIAFTPRQSCLPAGVPGFILYGGGAVRFLQTPKEVTMIFDGDMQVRRVYMDVPHSANVKPSWYGESVGHYEGDTLVIDTIGFNDKTFVDNFRTPHSEKLHMVERIHLVEDGKFLEADVTIEDPAVFIKPLQVTKRSRRVEASIIEWRCAAGEMGNPFADASDPIPVAAKAEF